MTDAGFVRRGGRNSALLAAMSYLGPLCLAALLANRDDEYVAFHAKQGLILWVWSMLAFVLIVTPVIGILLFQISFLLIAILTALGLVSVGLNKAWMLPFVHDLARKI